MADRASGKGNPVVPKEVFELDKDERWQARLDEARARREVALRDKAAGVPQKPRPKPWEIEGAEIEAPPEIDPIIQERGDDKFDFADRLETIRAPQGNRPHEAPTAKLAPVPPRAVPDKVKSRDDPSTHAKAPAPRARPQPSLILPGAPDVAELASRYAATLEPQAKVALRETGLEDPNPVPQIQSAELVTLPTAAKQTHEIPETTPISRSDRRRGIRPLGMAVTLVAFAVLPLTTEAPPLETGPEMPVVDVLRLQPALGVTWSLYYPPAATSSDDWRPGPVPGRLETALVPLLPPAAIVSDDTAFVQPAQPENGALNWAVVEPVERGSSSAFDAPELDPVLPRVEGAPKPLAAPEVVSPAPARPTVEPESVDDSDPTTSPAVPPGGQTVVEADPLRVTILAPSRSDRALAEEIASDIQNVGHELVRLKDVNFSISERNVRYFHDSDRAAAERMAERYGAELRDFTWFRPTPVEGTAELWLSGRAPSGGARPSSAGGSIGQLLERLGLSTELPFRSGAGN